MTAALTVLPPMGLVPATMMEAMKLADMMAGSKLVPAALQKSPADCLMVIQQAIRWEMDPFAVAQECSVIQGRLMYSGKLVAAVVNTRGRLRERLSYDYRGEGDNRAITVTGRLQGETEARSIEVRLANARTNAAVWKSQPDQQLMYHGARVWARRHIPEVMLGVYSKEEFDDAVEDAAAQQSGSRLLLAEEMNDEIPEHDERTHDEVDADLADAAEQGMLELERCWHTLPKNKQQTFKAALDRRYKPAAQQADAERENATDVVKQAGMRCADPRFHRFLAETNSGWQLLNTGTDTERAAELVRSIVGVKSRKDLATNNEAAGYWHDLEGKFQAWLRA